MSTDLARKTLSPAAIACIAGTPDRLRDAALLTVDRQRAEIARLHATLDTASRTIRDLTLDHDRQKDRADAAEARLRSHGIALA